MSGTGEAGLRGKYLDWCSARVAERFLDLTPEEIYELALPAEEEAGSHPGRHDPRDESYTALVRRATDALVVKLALPGFEEWARSYAEDPESYDRELLGFWKGLSGGDA